MLPDPDPEAVASYWRVCVDEVGWLGDGPVPSAWAFGDSPALAEELLALVVDGPKRATAGAVLDYEHEGEALPVPGDLSIVTDGTGRPGCLIQTTEVRVGPLESVDEAFAWDEGEGDRTRDWWLAAHIEFFERYLPTIGACFSPGLATVFERFRLVHVAGRGTVAEGNQPLGGD